MKYAIRAILAAFISAPLAFAAPAGSGTAPISGDILTWSAVIAAEDGKGDGCGDGGCKKKTYQAEDCGKDGCKCDDCKCSDCKCGKDKTYLAEECGKDKGDGCGEGGCKKKTYLAEGCGKGDGDGCGKKKTYLAEGCGKGDGDGCGKKKTFLA
jgi:hypothetical protein